MVGGWKRFKNERFTVQYKYRFWWRDGGGTVWGRMGDGNNRSGLKNDISTVIIIAYLNKIIQRIFLCFKVTVIVSYQRYRPILLLSSDRP